jgi:SUMO ligase MMS21 Smc5/6 complex component
MLKFEPTEKVDLNDFEMPSETRKRKKVEEEEEECENKCPICLEELDFTDNSSLQATNCNHVFHKDCLVEWATKKWNCPICRSPFKTRTLHLHQGELKYVHH